MAMTDPIVAWDVSIPGAGRTHIVDNVTYGTGSAAVQALVGSATRALSEMVGLDALIGSIDSSQVSLQSDATGTSLKLDAKLPGALALEGRLWMQGAARVPKGTPDTAKGYSVDRLVVGIRGDAFPGLGAEVLMAFAPLSKGQGKGKELSLQKLANAFSGEKASKKLANLLVPVDFYTDRPDLLQLAGVDTSGFNSSRDALLSGIASEAFPVGWNNTGFFA